MIDDPKALFGLRLAHVGINAADDAEAASIAEQFLEHAVSGIA